ncbi:capsule associated protein [Niveomyces insectorum RCEF 264]|uniref:Capsule associated protein n=1 Tax=Niveomyces insectorum RCEF 264 TaxID=1081102 RepID=A0A167ZC23_9HYPO|nr:capsule associated protein [Niveomyces insectorum RCEF 264]
MFFPKHIANSAGRRGPESFSTVARFACAAGLITMAAAGFLLFNYPPDTATLRKVAAKLPLFVPSPTTSVAASSPVAPLPTASSPAAPSLEADLQAALAAYDRLVADANSSAATATATSLHPIDHRIAAARTAHDTLLTRRSHTVADAAIRYRNRRGRHPPPGFEAWMAYAINHDAVIVEEFFDRIYHDLTPFWALEPNTLAARAAAGHHIVRVRSGAVSAIGDTTGRVPWLQLWTDLVAEAAPFLPDVDMPINYMDEPRVLVPWDDMARYVAKEQAERVLTPAAEALQSFLGLASVDEAVTAAETTSDTDGMNHTSQTNGTTKEAYEPAWITRATEPRVPFWDLARAACAPGSPSRDVPALAAGDDVAPGPLELPPPDWRGAPYTDTAGYVWNATAAADPCVQPHLRGLHAAFVGPRSMKTTTELVPLFSGCKLHVNNDIVLPGAMYLTDDPTYSGGEGAHGPDWDAKTPTVVWRGAATGGRNTQANWAHFQRHRLVELLNGTTVGRLEAAISTSDDGGGGNAKTASTFALAPLARYDYPRRRRGALGAWLARSVDVGFTDLLCAPQHDTDAGACASVAPFFHEVAQVPLADQYAHKFLPDADGNSFSARFRSLLRSTSVPLKATAFAEWHDARLQPWLHYVPLDNTLQELHAVLAFFTDDDDDDGGGDKAAEPTDNANITTTAPRRGDAAARVLATAGQRWAEQVLRREDMLLYVWRLLLEFARVCDENRQRLGYVADLPKEEAAAAAQGRV